MIGIQSKNNRSNEQLWFDYFAEKEDPDLPLPPEPTEHLAQSQEKVAVIEWRIANGYKPYHPLDAQGKYISTSIDLPCITVSGSLFRVATHRTVDGAKVRFSKSFTVLNDALDWLDWLNENYPAG